MGFVHHRRRGLWMPFTVLKQNSTGPYEDILATPLFPKLISNILKNYVTITIKIRPQFSFFNNSFQFFLKDYEIREN